jgi:lysophospholipase L1-like esterase
MIYIYLLLLVIVMCLLKYNFIEPLTNNTNNTTHNIVLIGDSMLNNSAYVLSGQSIPELISKDLANKTGITLYNFAKDGATINDCYYQLDTISSDLNNSNTYIFISIGGNNILNSRTKMDSAAIINLFNQYIELIKSIKTRVPNAQLIVLNLYFPVNSHYKSYYDAIDRWNKLLEDNTFLGYKLIQTNKLLVIEDDFAYDIEPSFKGGKKIAKAILDN